MIQLDMIELADRLLINGPDSLAHSDSLIG
jgi:hypothetical protein